MKKQKKTGICVIFILFFVIFTVWPGEQAGPRLTPQSLISDLAHSPLPLSLENTIIASLVLSGVPETGIKADSLRIVSIIENVNESIKDIDTEKAKAEAILLYLHKNILKRYSLNQTRIDVLLAKGAYNCVSSAVVYMIAAKAAGISVSGIKTKDHAFCRVQTAEGGFDVETTSEYGFNPGAKTDFMDKFGNITGYLYVPPGNYQERTEVSELELLSLILHNRITYLNDSNNYFDAVGLAVDLYTLIANDETRQTLIVVLGNMAHWYTLRKDFKAGIDFYDAVIPEFPEDPLFGENRFKLIHNYVIALLAKKDIKTAEEFIVKRYADDHLTFEQYREFMIYIILDKSNQVSKKSFEEAIGLIDASVETFGKDDRLLKIRSAFINNWIADLLNKKEWDAAESRLNAFRKTGDITEEKWKTSMTMVYDGRAQLVADKGGYFEAAAYLRKAMEIIGNDSLLKNNYEYYLYKYTVDIHNQAVKLVNGQKYREAQLLLEQGLEKVPDSALLKNDLENLKKKTS